MAVARVFDYIRNIKSTIRKLIMNYLYLVRKCLRMTISGIHMLVSEQNFVHLDEMYGYTLKTAGG